MEFQFPLEVAYSRVISTRQAYRDAEVLEATASVARDAAYKRDSVVERCEAEAVWGSAHVHLCTAADNHAEAEEFYFCLQSVESEAARVNPCGWQATLAASYRQRALVEHLQLQVERNASDSECDIMTVASDRALSECIEALLRDAESNRYSAQSLLEGGAL